MQSKETGKLTERALCCSLPLCSEPPGAAEAHFSAAADDLSTRHTQICALLQTIQLLLNEVSNSRQIDEDLVVIHHQLRRVELLLDEAAAEAAVLGDRDDRALWQRLGRGHKQKVKELRNELEWKKTTLREQAAKQRMETERQAAAAAAAASSAFANPFVHDSIGVEGTPTPSATPAAAVSVFPVIPSAPALDSVSASSLRVHTAAETGGGGTSNDAARRSLLSPLPAAPTSTPMDTVRGIFFKNREKEAPKSSWPPPPPPPPPASLTFPLSAAAATTTGPSHRELQPGAPTPRARIPPPLPLARPLPELDERKEPIKGKGDAGKGQGKNAKNDAKAKGAASREGGIASKSTWEQWKKKIDNITPRQSVQQQQLLLATQPLQRLLRALTFLAVLFCISAP